MSDLTFVPDARLPEIEFRSAPLHNMLCDLCMLNQDHLDHISPWVDEVVSKLTADERKAADLACHAVIHLRWTKATTMDEFIGALRDADPARLIEAAMEELSSKASHYLEDAPSAGTLVEDRESFMDVRRRLNEMKGDDEFDEAMVSAEYDQLSDAPAFQQRMVSALEFFWSEFLREGWREIERSVNESVAAFQSVRITGSSLEERLRFITGRDFIPEEWIRTLEEADRVIYVPSVHIGPYMILFDFDGSTAYLVGRARIPEGALVHSAALDRSDLLVRLDALSDVSRLRILELAAEQEVIVTQDVIERLELSQSSASRHLNQLAATGLLSVDGTERTKRYRVNQARMDEVCAGLKSLTGSKPKAGERKR